MNDIAKAEPRPRNAAKPAQGAGEVVAVEDTDGPVAKFNTARLPYHPAFKDRYDIDKGAWKALVEAIWPLATSVDSVAMALAYCKARNLDPFKRVVHIVPMWSKEAGGMVETVWPGIAELRTTAFRTGDYAGCDAPEFGDFVTGTFKDKNGSVTVDYPQWCRMTVYRVVKGVVCKFVGPKTVWLETYATRRNDSDVPNNMWASRPEGQIEKCAEAAALRRAFPEELGSTYAAEEMEGRTISGDVQGVPRVDPPKLVPPPIPDVPEPIADQSVTVDAASVTSASPAAEAATVVEPFDADRFIDDAEAQMAAATDIETLAEIWTTQIEPRSGELFPPDYEILSGKYRQHETRLRG